MTWLCDVIRCLRCCVKCCVVQRVQMCCKLLMFVDGFIACDAIEVLTLVTDVLAVC